MFIAPARANPPSPVSRHGVVPLLSALLALLALPAHAQSDLENRLRTRIEVAFSSDTLEVMDERVHARRTMQRLYTDRAFQPLWVGEDGLSQRGRALSDWLASEPQAHGLRAADYHLGPVTELATEDHTGALVDIELALTDAFLMVGSHFLAGRLNPESLDPEWTANRRHRDLLPVIEDAASRDRPGDVLADLLPRGDGYRLLVERLARLRAVRADGGWARIADGPTLREGDADVRVAQLASRLRGAAHVDGDEAVRYDPELTASVQRFQAQHGLNPDGVVGRATLKALNVPVQSRIEQIIVNLERWRWLPETLGERYIIVNIAGFSLDLFDNGDNRLSMRVVVGQPYRRTPVFSGTMTYLVLNPSWEVPITIARKDKLPVIKTDPSYLARQGYSLFEGWGADERLIDPATVDWASMTARSFRYRLRQAPGPMNALGRVKFMFPNAHSVYLHDTPSRELFSKESRTFSSGCIRLEQPLELAALLLAPSEQWNRDRIERTVASGTETVVTLPQSIPVHLLYWTAWADGDSIQFRDDVYGRDVRVLNELREAPPDSDEHSA